MLTRRKFLNIAMKTGIGSAGAALWLDNTSLRAMAELPGSYKAIVVVTLSGGNDGNNTVIPLDGPRYQQYAALRPTLAIPQSACLPLNGSANGQSYGLHPSLQNVASLYNKGKALVVANVGPLSAPIIKSQTFYGSPSVPEALFSHPIGVAQWESASTVAYPSTGWGGRMADFLVSQSGALPPLLDAGSPGLFTVGRSVQGIAVRGISNSPVALPAGIDAAILALAALDGKSSNNLISQAGSLRSQAIQQQALLEKAQTTGTPLRTSFPGSQVGQAMKTIASVINGRAATNASRQIFYTQQTMYDTHGNQLILQSGLLSELDSSIGAFMAALEEMGLSDQVLVVTLSDFNRSMVVNVSNGTDHAWGNHQFILGGGIKGGQVLGTFPDLDLGGSMDYNGTGIWIPSVSVTQMTAGVGAWMGLSSGQLTSVFPDLANFPGGPLSFA